MRYKILATNGGRHLFDQIKTPELLTHKGKMSTKVFSDNEMAVEIKESIRDNHIFLLAANSKAADIVELIITLDALYMASARSVTLILPYFGYSRQDKQEGQRGSLGAARMAKILTGDDIGHKVDRVVTIDLHSTQQVGYFNVPCEHLSGHAILLDKIKSLVTPDTMFISPDAGGTKRVETFFERIPGVPMGGINKVRKTANVIHSMELLNDVTGKDVIIIDDIVDTCGTVKKAELLLRENGAKSVSMVATHGVLSGGAIKNLTESKLNRLVITDTVPLTFYYDAYPGCPEIEVVSCVPIVEQAIKILWSGGSLSQLNN